MRWSRLDDNERATCEGDDELREGVLDAPDPVFDPVQAQLWRMYWDMRHQAGDAGVAIPQHDPILAHHVREMDNAYLDEVAKHRKQEIEAQKARSGANRMR